MPPLILTKREFFPGDCHPVAIADRYPQQVFAEHTHEFCEIVLVWRGNGLHILNDRPYRITCGDLFYIRAEDRHRYESVNNLLLHNVIYCPERLQLNVKWQELLPSAMTPYWRLSIQGMAIAHNVIQQLEQEYQRSDALSLMLTEALFLQLATLLQRHRYAPLQSQKLADGEKLDLLMATLGNHISLAFDMTTFCQQHQLAERPLRQLFRQQTGMTINQYLKQLRLCQAQYLLQHSDRLVSDIATVCGFDDSNYFSVVFTREIGMTPRQWRQYCQEKTDA